MFLPSKLLSLVSSKAGLGVAVATLATGGAGAAVVTMTPASSHVALHAAGSHDDASKDSSTSSSSSSTSEGTTSNGETSESTTATTSTTSTSAGTSSSATSTHPDKHGAVVTQAVAGCKANRDQTSSASSSSSASITDSRGHAHDPSVGSNGIGQCVSPVASGNRSGGGPDHGNQTGASPKDDGPHGKDTGSH